MAAKRTGLGRGIGALIPTADSDVKRPVDVFFHDRTAPTSTETATDGLVAVPGQPGPARERRARHNPGLTTTDINGQMQVLVPIRPTVGTAAVGRRLGDGPTEQYLRQLAA